MKFKSKRAIIILSIISACFLSSCSKKDENPVGPGPGGTTITNISGSLVNAPPQILVLRATVANSLDTFKYSDTILSGGTFNIELITPPPTVLQKIRTAIGTDTAYHISDTNTYFTSFGQLDAYNLTNTLVGRVRRKNFDDSTFAGSFAETYIYCDRAVDISGTRTTISGLGPDTSIVTYNLNLSEGWNQINTQYTVKRLNYSILSVSGGEPAGAIWRFEAVPRPDNLFLNKRFEF